MPDAVNRSLYWKGVPGVEARARIAGEKAWLLGELEEAIRETRSMSGLQSWSPEDVWELEDTRRCLVHAESELVAALTSGEVVGIGYDSPDDEIPKVIPARYWHFLTADFDQSSAIYQDVSFFGIRFLQRSEMSDAEIEAVESASITKESAEGLSNSESNDVLGRIRAMENLKWDEVTMTVRDKDIVEVQVRQVHGFVHMKDLGLIKSGRGAGGVNRAGEWFLLLATRKAKANPAQLGGAKANISSARRKQVSRLRSALRRALGIKEEPLEPVTDTGIWKPRFNLTDGRVEADQRAKERAYHYEFDDRRDGMPSGHATDDSDDDYPYDPGDDESDAETDTFLREHDD